MPKLVIVLKRRQSDIAYHNQRVFLSCSCFRHLGTLLFQLHKNLHRYQVHQLTVADAWRIAYGVWRIASWWLALNACQHRRGTPALSSGTFQKMQRFTHKLIMGVHTYASMLCFSNVFADSSMFKAPNEVNIANVPQILNPNMCAIG